MARRSAVVIATLFAVAAVAGGLALSRTLDAGAVAQSANDRLVAARTSQLDRFERSLHRQLASLPQLPTSAGAASERPPRVVYVRPAPIAAQPVGHDDEREHEEHADSDGSGFDD